MFSINVVSGLHGLLRRAVARTARPFALAVRRGSSLSGKKVFARMVHYYRWVCGGVSGGAYWLRERKSMIDCASQALAAYGDELRSAATILLAALVTYGLRLGGLLLSERLPKAPAFKRFMDALPGAVLRYTSINPLSALSASRPVATSSFSSTTTEKLRGSILDLSG